MIDFEKPAKPPVGSGPSHDTAGDSEDITALDTGKIEAFVLSPLASERT